MSLSPVQRRLADNVRRTVALHPGAKVRFLDDQACAEAILAMEKTTWKLRATLLAGFLTEKDGSAKGDVCRGAILHSVGGHYFDVDIYPVIDVRDAVPKAAKFVTCGEARRVSRCHRCQIAALLPGPITMHRLITGTRTGPGTGYR